MDKVIRVDVRNVYGNDVVYPVCNTAKILAQLSGHKTLTAQSVYLIKKLGYTIEVVSNIPKQL